MPQGDRRRIMILTSVHQKHLKEYQADPKAAAKLLTVGFYPAHKMCANWRR